MVLIPAPVSETVTLLLVCQYSLFRVVELVGEMEGAVVSAFSKYTLQLVTVAVCWVKALPLVCIVKVAVKVVVPPGILYLVELCVPEEFDMDKVFWLLAPPEAVT